METIRQHIVVFIAATFVVGCTTSAEDVPPLKPTAGLTSFKGQCLDASDCAEGMSCRHGLCRLINAVESPTYHQDVRPMVEMFCGGCHAEGGVGGFAFETYDQVRVHNELIMDAVQSGRMPPWVADDGCVDYVNDPRLLESERETLANWVASGMPEGDPSQAVSPPARIRTAIDRVDIELVLEEPYVPEVDGWPEKYRCHTFRWPETESKYITGFEGEPGWDLSVHHAVFFMSPPGPLAEQYLAKQDEDEEPGWACEGGTFLYDLESVWIGTWSPGNVGSFGMYPDGTGIRIEPGAVVSALVHYDLFFGQQAGQLGFRATLEDDVEREAIVLPWLDPGWVGTDKMRIPAFAEDVTHSYADDLWGLADDGPVAIHAAAFHMHSRGSKGSLSILRGSGDEECLFSVSNWTEDWQFQHTFSEAKPFYAGDQLNISCTFDNVQEKQPTPFAPIEDVYWGDIGLDEMCLGILYVSWPKPLESLTGSAP